MGRAVALRAEIASVRVANAPEFRDLKRKLRIYTSDGA